MKDTSLFSIPKPHVYTVTELTQAIKQILENEFSFIWVEGEISNVRSPLSGHLYFTLKDERAQLSCILFKNQRLWLKFEPEDGLKVVCQSKIGVHPPYGNYRLIVEYLEPKGYGALQLAFEQLKKKLEREGLFDPTTKKTLPFLPRYIAVVTSPIGAAIRDFLRVVLKKFPSLNIRIYPVRVQGEEAAKEIAEAIYDLNRLGWAEVIVVTRGGGSLEDLWAFNEEVVARAIHASKIPIVSAIGHEIDFTITDMVADVRAPTPTAAAEIIVQKKEDLEDFLEKTLKHLPHILKNQLETDKLHLTHLSKQLTNMCQQLITYRLQLDELSLAFLRVFRHVRERQKVLMKNLAQRFLLCFPKRYLEKNKERVRYLQKELMIHFNYLLEKKYRCLDEIKKGLNTLSPLNILKRGYALVFSFPEKKLIKSIKQVEIKENIIVKIIDGEIKARVEDKDGSTL
jgi:exodeoxyribonuclease VII large subunit